MEPQHTGFRPASVESNAYPRPVAQRVSAIPVQPTVAPHSPRDFGLRPAVSHPTAPQASPATPEAPFVALPDRPRPAEVADPSDRFGGALETAEPTVASFDSSALESAPQNDHLVRSEPVAISRGDRFSLFRLNRLAIGVTATVLVIILLVGGSTLFLTAHRANSGQSDDQRAASYPSGTSLKLNEAQAGSQLRLGEASQLTVNGQLQLSDTVVVKPTARPSSPQTGQIYYDQSTNQPYYYDGKQFISLAPQGGVTSLGGATGVIGLGSGLVESGGQLSLSSDVLQQLAGAAASGSPQLLAGSGIGINGGRINNLGVIGLAAGSSNLAVSSDGSGHYTIVDTSAGSTVNSITGTLNQVNVSSSTGNVTLSLPQDIAASSAPAFGGLTVNGSGLIKTTSTTALQIQDGTGSTNLFVADTADGRVGIGTAGPGYRLDVQGGDINTSGIYRVNGAQISSANLSNDSNLAKLNGSNTFTAANTFSGTVSVQGANSLTLGSDSNVGSITFRDGSSANTATLQVAGTLSGNESFVLPTGMGTQTVCTVELGNCAGSGSGITGSGTANHLARFTGSQTLADSSITDDGTVVTVSTGEVIQGAGGLTIGASGVNGQLVFQNGSNGNKLTLQSGVTTGNLTLTLPTADGSDGQCLKTNGSGILSFAACTGGAGGGVTSVNSLTGMINVVGTANQVSVSTAGDTITLSLPQDINTGGNATFRTVTLDGAAAGDNLIVANAISGATGKLINLEVNSVSKFAVDPNGNVNAAGQYQINGAQISSSNLADGSNLAKLNGSGPQVFTGNNKFTGTFLSRNAADSTTAFQIQNAAGTSNLFDADTQNSRIGIGTAAPGYTLDVNGDINTSGVYRVNGVAVCAATGCTPAGGSGNYIQNGTAPQTADFNITGSGTVGNFTANGAALFKDSTNSTTAFQIQNAAGSTAFSVDTTVHNGYATVNVGGAGYSDAELNWVTDGSKMWALGTEDSGPFTDGFYLYNYGSGGTVFSEDPDGHATFRNSSNASDAFEIQNASGEYLLNVDTNAGQINFASGVDAVATFDNGATPGPTGGAHLDFQDDRAEVGYDGFEQNAYLLGGTGKGIALRINNTWDALSISSTGTTILQNQTDSASGFQVQAASGDPLFNVNTSTGDVNIDGDGNGHGDPGSKLSFGDFQATSDQTVFVGESGTTDTDRLQLNGEQGIQLTTGSYTSPLEVAQFYIDSNFDHMLLGENSSSTGSGIDLFTGTNADPNWEIGNDDGSTCDSSIGSQNLYFYTTAGGCALQFNYNGDAVFLGEDDTNAFQILNDGSKQILNVDTSGNAITLFGGVTGGTLTTDIAGTMTHNAVCHSGGASANANVQIVACASGTVTADYAEAYPVASGASYGDIVATGTNMVNTYNSDSDGNADWSSLKGQITQLVKSTAPYQTNAIGIISDNPNSGGQNVKPEDNPMPVALNGRVPVNVSPSSAAIEPGDYLTTSGDTGKAMKATGAGFIIGKALAAWDPASGQTQVMVFVQPGYWPGPTPADTIQNGGDASLSSLDVSGMANFADLNVSGTATINNLAVTTLNAASAAIGTLTVTGSAQFAGNITIGGHLITGGVTPAAQAQTAAGSGASCTVSGNDTGGSITITTGASGLADGKQCVLTFHTAFGAMPNPVIAPRDKAGVQAQAFVDADTHSMTVEFSDAPAANTTYAFDYFNTQ
jgi:hypothetical protein